jgi:hypothetical protein
VRKHLVAVVCENTKYSKDIKKERRKVTGKDKRFSRY